MGFFKDLKSRVRSQVQPPMSPRPQSMGDKFERMFGMSRQSPRPMPPPFMRRRQAPGTVLDLETGLPPVRLPEITKNIGVGAMAPDKFMPGGGLGPLPRRLPQIMPDNRAFLPDTSVNPPGNFLRGPRRLPQIIPERMPSPTPTPRFSGGGLGSIIKRFARLQNQRVREGMSPPLPRAPLPIPQDMPRERFPMMRPGFAEGEEIDMRKIFAEQAARQGISPPEVATQKLKQFLGETGRTVSNRDAELYGMGMLTLEDIIDRATDLNVQKIIGDSGRTISNMDRNLMQQEQMFFPQSESLDDILADLEKKN